MTLRFSLVLACVWALAGVPAGQAQADGNSLLPAPRTFAERDRLAALSPDPETAPPYYTVRAGEPMRKEPGGALLLLALAWTPTSAGAR